MTWTGLNCKKKKKKKKKKHAIAFSHCKRCYSKCDHRLCIWINKTYILSFKMYRVNVGVVNSDPQFVIASALHRIKYAFLGRGISPVVYCITTINYVLESGGGETYCFDSAKQRTVASRLPCLH